MFYPDQLARIRYEDRLSEADQRRTAARANTKARTSGFDKLQSAAVFIGMALLPLGESLRSPISEPHSLDISTQQPEKHRA
jgi:hypothetical protein